MAFIGIYSVLIIIGTIVCLYFILKNLFSKNYNSFFKWLLISVFALIILIAGAWCYITYSTPKSFREGVKIILQDDTLLNKIGSYESYSYKDSQLPKDTDNPAKFQIEINGSKAQVYLTCEMIKNSSDNWSILQLKEDSLRQLIIK